ncbi:MAG: FecR domain-containing protein [Elusimicrobia bacterium]|nr:FecR domain-containing protein [Elusimicrobiota bacterium]
MRLKKTLAILTTLCLSAGPAWPELVRIGGAGAVRGSVNAVAPDAKVGRVIESGKTIYLNDHVTTKNESRLQVLLLDESVFTLGPNSDMVLDEFIYDPNSDAGKVTAKLTKGVFRFVTGKVARQSPTNMKVNVPTGTIGIRGTKAAVEVKPDNTLVILEGAGKNNTANETPGRLEVSTGKGDSQSLTKEGFGSNLPDGGAASPPTDHSGDLARINADLSPKPGSNVAPPETGGGAKSDATEETGGVIGALTSLGDTKTSGGETNTASQTTTQATQSSANSIVDGTTTWDFIRSQIVTGDGFYFSGHSPISCTGVGCNGSGNPVGAVQLYINFAAATFGGATSFSGPSGFTGSFIHIHGINAASQGDTIQQLIGGGGAGLTAIPFPTGSSVITLATGSNTDSSTTGNPGGTGNFDGTTISLQNSGGVVAKNAAVNLVWTGTNSSASSINASGSFIAPR